MNSFKIKIEQRALLDIELGFNYYEAQQTGLGVRFNQAVFHSFETLKQNPFYQIRYDNFRCLPIKKFPFMVHYEVEEDIRIVNIYAIINSHRNPVDSWLNT